MLGQTGESVVGNRQACGSVGSLSQFSETSQGVQSELEGRLEIFLPPGRGALSLGLSKEEVIFGSCRLPTSRRLKANPQAPNSLFQAHQKGGGRDVDCRTSCVWFLGLHLPGSGYLLPPGLHSPEPGARSRG